ncbi:hypothetical protein BRADI_2g12047v3 [Brachypodium distachyon]|uniref:Pectin acetylesterase n=1 Tax=Brachypodium distachyon TaxID=15368 RepID=I1HF04_BRADI|nr:hypothetical protein BRADI_2g12047v3 [Brachypodium distachyon]
MKARIRAVRPWLPLALLLLVLVLSCVAQAAVNEQANGGGRRRRRSPRRSTAAADGMVPITLLKSAAEKGAVCMDGTPPAYHLDPGSGAGNNSWIVNLEGGGWCNNARTCKFRTRTRHGSSDYMERHITFSGIMSASPASNPDFYSWNRVKIRYCDSASFAGDNFDKGTGLYFRGQRIWDAAIQHLLSIGMASADQVLLTGCSAGGLAAILHCDQFSAFFAGKNTTVKCLADAGLFLDAYAYTGCLRGPQLEILLRRNRSHAGSGPEPAAQLHRSSRRHLVLLPSERNRQHQDPHLPAKRSLRRLADRGKPGPKQS